MFVNKFVPRVQSQRQQELANVVTHQRLIGREMLALAKLIIIKLALNHCYALHSVLSMQPIQMEYASVKLECLFYQHLL